MIGNNDFDLILLPNIYMFPAKHSLWIIIIFEQVIDGNVSRETLLLISS